MNPLLPATPSMPCIPPPPPARPTFPMLQTGNDAIDLALWQVLRDVLLWVRTPMEERGLLFDPPGTALCKRMAEASDAAPLLADPLSTLARLRRVPGEQPLQIAAACQHVTDWAERSGLIPVALHFAEATAYVDPINPLWAVRAGYLARLVGGLAMFARSEVWHARAYVIAVQKRNSEVVLRTLTSFGALMKDMGHYGRARRMFLRAARRAERDGRKRQAAVARHYSFALAAETGHTRIAVRDALEALNNYPLHDERLPALAHDVAFLLIRLNHHATALRLIDGLGERVDGIWSMGMLYGMTARAAAGAGFGGSYFEASESAAKIARIHDECAPSVFFQLAQASRSLRRWEEATEHALAALSAARKRADKEIERVALGLLEEIERREQLPPACEPASDTPIAALARRLAARVRRWRRYQRGARVVQRA